MGEAVKGQLPLVSVLMPVRNGLPYIDEAIRSIVSQTWTQWELVIVDDGSTDGTSALLTQWAQADERIRIIRQSAQGLVASSNAAIAAARGEYLARLDSDDVALPNRLAWQVACMERFPKLLAIGSSIRLFGEHGGLLVTPMSNWGCKGRLLFENCFAHSSVMLRRGTIEALLPLYEARAEFAEDFALWVRLAPHGDFANIPIPLVKYRVHAKQVSRERAQALRLRHAELSVAQWRELGVVVSVEDFLVFRWPNFEKLGSAEVALRTLRFVWHVRALLGSRYLPQAAWWLASVSLRNLVKVLLPATRNFL